MKKFLNLLLIIALTFSFLMLSGCSNKSLKDEDFESLVTLQDYSKINVDFSSTEYLMGIAYLNFSKLLEIDGYITYTGYDEGTLQVLDTAIIKYEGKIDGKAFEGGSSDGYDLVLGSSSFIDGFEKGLLGVKVGETVVLNLKFPDDYQSEEYAGKDVKFTVTVKGFERPNVPKMTDKVANNLGYNTVDEYEKAVESEYISNYVWTEFMGGSKVTRYPQYAIDEYIEKSVESLKEAALSESQSVDEYLSANGLTLDGYKEALLPYAESYVKQRMVCYYFAKLKSIEVTETEIDSYITENNQIIENVSDNERNDIYDTILSQKVLEFLIENVGYVVA